MVAQLLLKCRSRDYLFQMSCRDECERWASNIVQLAGAAGHTVPGYAVITDDDDDDDDARAREMRT